MKFYSIIFTATFTLVSLAAQAQFVPGYLGKKHIVTYEYQTSLNFRDDGIRSYGRLFFKNRHFIGYERVINESASLKFDLGYSTTTFRYEGFDFSDPQFEPNDKGFMKSHNFSFGMFYKNYSFLSPIGDYVSYGVRVLSVNTPEVSGTQDIATWTGSSETVFQSHDAASTLTAGFFIQIGKSRIIKDVVYIDSYIEFGLTYFDFMSYNDYEREVLPHPSGQALARVFSHNLLNVGISIGFIK